MYGWFNFFSCLHFSRACLPAFPTVQKPVQLVIPHSSNYSFKLFKFSSLVMHGINAALTEIITVLFEKSKILSSAKTEHMPKEAIARLV